MFLGNLVNFLYHVFLGVEIYIYIMQGTVGI